MKHNYQERRERRIQWMVEASEGLCEFHGPVLSKKRLEEMGDDRLRTMHGILRIMEKIYRMELRYPGSMDEKLF
jgi:hypothetical protein